MGAPALRWRGDVIDGRVRRAAWLRLGCNAPYPETEARSKAQLMQLLASAGEPVQAELILREGGELQPVRRRLLAVSRGAVSGGPRQLVVRCTEELYAAIGLRASDAGVTRSDWCRSQLLQATRRK